MTNISISPKYSDVKPTGFYVYLHRRATDGSVFYVGKGKGFRGWRGLNHRNPHWINVAKKHGVIVDIYKDGMIEDCSFSLEKILIGIVGVGNICNISHGGEGVSGKLGPIHHGYDHTIFKFINVDGRDFEGTSYDFRVAYELEQSTVSNLVNGVRKSHKGWRLCDTKFSETGMRGSRVWNYDHRVFTFHHKEKGIFTGTQRDLIDKYKLDQSGVNGLVNGKTNHTYGWYLNKELLINGSRGGERNPSYDSECRTFTHKNGNIFMGTQYNFRVKFGLDFRGVSGIVTGRNKTHKGWSVK